MNIAVYPGTFDPITNGHIDVIRRTSGIFDRVIVTVAANAAKQPLFTVSERLSMIRTATRGFRNVGVDSFDGLLVEFARAQKARVIVRGLRAASDFEYELQMAQTNRNLEEDITTVFLMPHERYGYLSSTLVREIALLGGDVSQFVPPVVRRAFTLKVRSRKRRS